MKIVFLSRYQNINKRGVETFTKELTDRLSKKMEVDVFSGNDADNLNLILAGQYDVVVPQNGRLQSLMVSLGRLAGRYKTVVIGHSGIGRDDIWNISVTKPDVYVALTETMLVWANRWAWGTGVVKIPNGVDIAMFNPTGVKVNLDLERPIILCTGALTWYKHQEQIIEAVSLLEKGSLLLIGTGPEYDRLQSLGRKKLGNNFKIIEVPYNEMPKYYRSVDLFTLPSWDREAFGIVYLEALSSNLPVVAPNDLARKEIIGNGGILTNTADPQSYKDALIKALDENWKQMPRDQAKQFSWNVVAKRYEDLFKGLASGKLQ